MPFKNPEDRKAYIKRRCELLKQRRREDPEWQKKVRQQEKASKARQTPEQKERNKACTRETKKKAWRDPEKQKKLKERNKFFYEKHKEKRLKQQCEYHKKVREERLEKMRQYQIAQKEAISARRKEAYKKHRDRIRAYNNAWVYRTKPHRGIATALRAVKRGDMSLDEFDKFVSERIALADSISSKVGRGE